MCILLSWLCCDMFSVCLHSYRIPAVTEPQTRLTMDSDGFSVLQNRIPCRHLHSDCTDAFPGECARHASLQGDYWLLGEKERERDVERVEEADLESESGGSAKRPLSTAGLTLLLFTLQRCQPAAHSSTHTRARAHFVLCCTQCRGPQRLPV